MLGPTVKLLILIDSPKSNHKIMFDTMSVRDKKSFDSNIFKQGVPLFED